MCYRIFVKIILFILLSFILSINLFANQISTQNNKNIKTQSIDIESLGLDDLSSKDDKIEEKQIKNNDNFVKKSKNNNLSKIETFKKKYKINPDNINDNHIIDYNIKNKIEKSYDIIQKMKKEYNRNYFEYIDDIKPIRKIEKHKFIKTAEPLVNKFKHKENSHHPFIYTQNERYQMLFDVIKKDMANEFIAIIDYVDNINIKNDKGETLLTSAILWQNRNIILALIARGVDLEKLNDNGYTPFNIAIEMNLVDICQILIENNVNINYVNALGRNYLIQAITKNNFNIVKLLVENNIDINHRDNNGNTALSTAYRLKNEMIIGYLKYNNAKE